MSLQENEDLLNAKDKKNGTLYYASLPADRRTYKVSWAAVESNPRNLRYVPENHLDNEIIMMAAKIDGLVIEEVSSYKLKDEVYKAAVEQNFAALQFVPEESQTKELCRIALNNADYLNPESCNILWFIPHSDICFEGLKAFENSQATPYEVLNCIRPELITEEIAVYAVKQDAVNINLIPDRIKNTQMYLEAVKQDGMMLFNVPEKERTREIIENAIDSNFHSLRLLADEMKTDEFCMRALSNHPFAIQYFPADKLTHEVCVEASKNAQHLRILEFIPFPDIHYQVLEEKCNDYSTIRSFLDHVNPNLMDQKTANRVFEKEPELFYKIPDHLKTKEICEAAVNTEGLNIKYIPERFKTDELYMKAIRQEPLALGCIPDKWRNEEFYTAMVEENPINLRGVPRDERTADMCLSALDMAMYSEETYLSVVAAVTDSKLLLEVFEQEDDPKKIEQFLQVVDRDTLTPEIALDAMAKNGKYLYLIPENIITSNVAEAAVKNYPSSLQFVPVPLRTADMTLFTIKSTPGYKANIDDSILTTDNIYTFHKRIEKAINKSLSYEDHKKLYSGDPIKVNNVQTVKGVVKNAELRYDLQEKRLTIKPIQLSEAEKQEFPDKTNRKNKINKNRRKL